MIAGEDWDANTNRRSRPPGRKCVASLKGGSRGFEENQRRSGRGAGDAEDHAGADPLGSTCLKSARPRTFLPSQLLPCHRPHPQLCPELKQTHLRSAALRDLRFTRRESAGYVLALLPGFFWSVSPNCRKSAPGRRTSNLKLQHDSTKHAHLPKVFITALLSSHEATPSSVVRVLTVAL